MSEDEEDAVKLALDLRIQLLETLVGLDTPAASRTASLSAGSITRRGQIALAEIYNAVEKAGSESVKRFLDSYEANAPLLIPQLPSAAIQANSAGNDLSARAKASLVLEAEHDIRTIERELREIDTLEKRGIAGAGTLASHEKLQPELLEARKQVTDLSSKYSTLESSAESLLSSYDHYVSTISELFVSWNDALTQAERTVARLEREKAL